VAQISCHGAEFCLRRRKFDAPIASKAMSNQHTMILMSCFDWRPPKVSMANSKIQPTIALSYWDFSSITSLAPHTQQGTADELTAH
jgi:hypothetical protein